MLDRIFIDFSVHKLRQLHSRIEDCLDRLDEEQIWARGPESSNAIGNLVLHLAGNVRQWILFGVAGQPDVRVRDREFAARGEIGKQDLLEGLRSTLEEAIPVIEQVSAERLSLTTKVQNYELPVLAAIGHVVEHFAMHTGQIIFATKMLTEEDLGFYRHLGTPKRRETAS
jgi:uncharacterized damage-inducible protein DinB